MMLKKTDAEKIMKTTIKKMLEPLHELNNNYDVSEEEWNQVKDAIDTFFEYKDKLKKR